MMDLQDPTSKMSKSTESDAGLILLLDSPDTIARKFKRAVTDSDAEVRYDPVTKPGVSNLLEILAALRDDKPENVAAGYTQYGPLKADAGDAVIEALRPIRERATELLADRGELAALLHKGSEQGAGGRRGDARAGLRRRRPAPRVGRAPIWGNIVPTPLLGKYRVSV